MAVLMVFVALLAVLLGTLALFLRADPRHLAEGLRAVGPLTLGLSGIAATVAGRAGIGGPVLLAALAWWVFLKRRTTARPLPG